MKRRPDLMKKMKQDSLPSGHSTIGILGTAPGVGVTHTGIMLANLIGGRNGKRTALLEINQSGNFKALQKAYEGEKKAEEKNRYFDIFRIRYYSDVQGNEVISILNLNYECLIFDFGSDRNRNMEEFLRCTEKIVICNLTEWKFHELLQFLEEVKEITGYQSWKYIAVLGDKSSAVYFGKKYGIKILCMELQENPFALSKNTMNVLQKIF